MRHRMDAWVAHSEGRRLIIVTHRGAKTGKLHKSPLIRIPHDAGYIVVASCGGGAKRTPRVTTASWPTRWSMFRTAH